MCSHFLTPLPSLLEGLRAEKRRRCDRTFGERREHCATAVRSATFRALANATYSQSYVVHREREANSRTSSCESTSPSRPPSTSSAWPSRRTARATVRCPRTTYLCTTLRSSLRHRTGATQVGSLASSASASSVCLPGMTQVREDNCVGHDHARPDFRTNRSSLSVRYRPLRRARLRRSVARRSAPDRPRGPSVRARSTARMPSLLMLRLAILRNRELTWVSMTSAVSTTLLGNESRDYRAPAVESAKICTSSENTPDQRAKGTTRVLIARATAMRCSGITASHAMEPFETPP